jgi:hypothetical protein
MVSIGPRLDSAPEKGTEPDIKPRRVNVAEVPEAAIGECERPALAAAVCQCAFGGDDQWSF